MILLNVDKTYIVASMLNLKKGKDGTQTEDFNNHKSALKAAKFSFNYTTKRWEMLIPMWNSDTLNVLKILVEVKIVPEALDIINKWDLLTPSELKKEELHPFNYTDYSYYPPYIGKHPYEDYQKEDIEKALQQNRFLFDWEMGLGKTYASVIIYEYSKEFRGVEKLVLLTSNIGTRNLKDELVKLDKHLAEDDIEVFTNVKSFTGFRKKWGKAYKNTRRIFDMDVINNKKVLIMSYGAWSLICNAYKKDKKNEQGFKVPIHNFLKGVGLLCLDECHQISNPKTDRSKAIYPYLKIFPYRYLFSATPSDEPEKLYYLGRILDPKLVHFLPFNDWVNKYNDVGTIYSKYAINPRRWHWDDLNKLNANLEPFTAVRTAEDCLELPECFVVDPFYIEMDEGLENIYKSFINALINKSIQDGGDVKSIKDIIRENFMRIISILENPKVLLRTWPDFWDKGTKDLIEKYNYENSNKLDVLDDVIEERDSYKDRGIIWFIHPETGEALKKRYEKLNPVLVGGKEEESERAKLIKEFQKNEKHKILIASILVLNTSLTLTEANYGVYLENTFSYQMYFQSTGRIKRIGQTKHTYIYHSFYKNTIDMFHKKSIDNKSDFSKALFDSKQWLGMDLKGLKEFFNGEFDYD